MVYINVNVLLFNIDSLINYLGCEGGDSNVNEVKICNFEVSVIFLVVILMYREISKEN